MLENSIPLLLVQMCCYRGLTQVFSVPLHHTKLKSNFVSGQVVVGVGPTLPVDDIALLFGIDMAGDKVLMAPITS